MNAAQIRLYRFHVRDWKAAREARGLPVDREARMKLHAREIGRACSSTEFTQKELDKVLAALLAESKPADFNAQMKQQDQPENRKAAALARCDSACRAMADAACGEYQFSEAETRMKYIAKIAMNVIGKWPEACDDHEIVRVAGVLEARVKQLREKLERHAKSVVAKQKAWVAAGRPEGGEAVDAHPVPKPAPMLEPGEDF